MPYQSVRTFFITLWSWTITEAFRLLISAVLAIATSSYFEPGMPSPLKISTAILLSVLHGEPEGGLTTALAEPAIFLALLTICFRVLIADRKSTRLNSSHLGIS